MNVPAVASDELPTDEPAPSTGSRGRTIAIVLGWIGVVAQVLVVVQAFLCVPRYRGMFADFGIELPSVSLALMATYPLWAVAPVLSAAVLIAMTCRGRERAHGIWPVAVGIFAMAFLLEAWTVQGFLLPLLKLHDALS